MRRPWPTAGCHAKNKQTVRIYRGLQVAVFVFIFLKVAKVNKYIYHDPSDRSLFFHKVVYKIHTPFKSVISLKTLPKNIRSAITVVIFSYACVLRSSI